MTSSILERCGRNGLFFGKCGYGSSAVRKRRMHLPVLLYGEDNLKKKGIL
jgi:hypothetical protein